MSIVGMGLSSRTIPGGVLCVTKPHTAPTERKRRVESCYRHVSVGAKIYILGVVLDLTFVQSNLHREPISYIELTLLDITQVATNKF